MSKAKHYETARAGLSETVHGLSVVFGALANMIKELFDASNEDDSTDGDWEEEDYADSKADDDEVEPEEMEEYDYDDGKVDDEWYTEETADKESCDLAEEGGNVLEELDKSAPSSPVLNRVRQRK